MKKIRRIDYNVVAMNKDYFYGIKLNDVMSTIEDES